MRNDKAAPMQKILNGVVYEWRVIVVILIGAASNTGKTLMAQKLLELHKITYLSIDHLKMGLFRADENCKFTPDDSNKKIEKYLWPIIKGIIMTNIENNQNIIIEGCYLFPNRIKEFNDEYLKHIIPVFMGFSRSYIEQNFISGIIRYMSEIESKESEERPMAQFVMEHMEYKEMCKKSNIKFFEIDENYEKEIDIIYQWIDKEYLIKMQNNVSNTYSI